MFINNQLSKNNSNQSGSDNNQRNQSHSQHLYDTSLQNPRNLSGRIFNHQTLNLSTVPHHYTHIQSPTPSFPPSYTLQHQQQYDQQQHAYNPAIADSRKPQQVHERVTQSTAHVLSSQTQQYQGSWHIERQQQPVSEVIPQQARSYYIAPQIIPHYATSPAPPKNGEYLTRPLLELTGSQLKILPLGGIVELTDKGKLRFFQVLIKNPSQANYNLVLNKKDWDLLIYSLLVPNTFEKCWNACQTKFSLWSVQDQIDVCNLIKSKCSLFKFPLYPAEIRSNFENFLNACDAYQNKIQNLSIDFIPAVKVLHIIGRNITKSIKLDEGFLKNVKEVIRFVNLLKKSPDSPPTLNLDNQYLTAQYRNSNFSIFYILAILGGPKAYLLNIENMPSQEAFERILSLKRNDFVINSILCHFFSENLNDTLNALKRICNPKMIDTQTFSRYVTIYFDTLDMKVTPIDNGKYDVNSCISHFPLDFHAYSWFLKNDNEKTVDELVTMFREEKYPLLNIILSLPGNYSLFYQANQTYIHSLSPELQALYPEKTIRKLSQAYQNLSCGNLAFYDTDFYENYYKLCDELSVSPPPNNRTDFASIIVNKLMEDYVTPQIANNIRIIKVIYEKNEKSMPIPVHLLDLLKDNLLVDFNHLYNFYLPAVLFKISPQIYKNYLNTIKSNPKVNLKEHFAFLKNSLTYFVSKSKLLAKANSLELEMIPNHIDVLPLRQPSRSSLTQQIVMQTSVQKLLPKVASPGIATFVHHTKNQAIAMQTYVQEELPKVASPGIATFVHHTQNQATVMQTDVREELSKAASPEIATFVQTLDKHQKQLFRRTYLIFYEVLMNELKHPHSAIGFRAFLLQERGFFGFDDTEREYLLLPLLNKVWRQFEVKCLDIDERFKKQIANDFLTFFVIITKSNDLINEEIIIRNQVLKDEVSFGKTPLTPEDTSKILETFFKIKLKEYKNHIHTCTSSIEVNEPKLIPCCFVHYNEKHETVLKIHSAFFDKYGILRALFSGDNINKDIINSLLHLDPSSDQRVISYQDLELLKLTLEEANDVPFIILEEKALQKNIYETPIGIAARKKNSNEPPKKRRKVTQSKTSATRNAIVANDIHLLAEPSPLVESTKSTHRSSTSLFSHNNEISGSFWQRASISQCQSAQNKSKPARPLTQEIQPLKWKLPDLSTVGKSKRPLYMMQAKEYQQKGINTLLDLHEIGISGLLRWWMGLGKSLVAQELCMRLIAENDIGSMLILTPNHVRSQLMNETRERIAKAKFAALLSTAYHLQELPIEEKQIRLEAIEQIIDKGFPKRKVIHSFVNFRPTSSNLPFIKHTLILLAALPDKEKRTLLSSLHLDHPNIRKILVNLVEQHLQEILVGGDENEIFKLIEKIAKQKVTKISEIVNIINNFRNKEEFLANFVGQLLVIDPSFPYNNARDTFLAQNLSEFKRILAFSCDTQISSVSFTTATLPAEKVHIYFGSYHEFSKAKEQVITQFAQNTGTLQVFADEAHTLSENSKISKTKSKTLGKNKSIKFLFEKLREANPKCRIIPSSGTFVRGKLNELLYLFELFNPNLISKDTQASIRQSFQKGMNALQAILKKEKLTNCENEIQDIVSSYAHLLTFGQIINAISIKAHPKDANVQQDWNGRMPLKKTIKKDYSLVDLGICQEVQVEAARLNANFRNLENMHTIQNDLDRLLIYPGLSEKNLAEVQQKIRSAASHPLNMKEELSKSYRASALIKILNENQAIEKKQKVIVFTHRILTTNVLQTYLESYYQGQDLRVHLYNGSTGKKQRSSIIESFRKDTGAHVLLISLQTGSVGLNLPEADAIYMVETVWEPMERKQAKYRANRANTVGNKVVFALDKLDQQFAVERNRQNVLKMKTKLSNFCSDEFKSHQEHISLYLDALQWHAQDQSYKVMRNFSQELIDCLIPKLQHLLQTEVSKPEFLENFERISPTSNSNSATELLTEINSPSIKGKERIKVSPEENDHLSILNADDLEILNQLQMGEFVELDTELFEEVANIFNTEARAENILSFQATDAKAYPIHSIFSIPIQHGSLERATICADAILCNNNITWIVNAIKVLNNAIASDPSLRYTIRNLGFNGLSDTQKMKIQRFSEIQRLYVWLDTILREKEEEESEENRPKHIYSYQANSQEYIRSSILGNEKSDNEAIKLREVKNGSNITYDVLVLSQ